MIDRELFVSLEYIVNMSSQFLNLATDLNKSDDLIAIKSGWVCDGAPFGGLSWVFYTVDDHKGEFDTNITDREVEAFLVKLRETIKASGLLRLDLTIINQNTRTQANQLAEDVAEATGV